MPEKTLKESTSAKATVDEKVDAARRYVDAFHIQIIQEALTALEEKVKELEKEREPSDGELGRILDFFEEGLGSFSEYRYRIGRLRTILNIPKEAPDGK